MVNWVVNVPVWGDGYHEKFLKRGLPSIIEASDTLNLLCKIRFIIHTDRPRIASAIPFPVEVRPIPEGPNSTRRLGEADRYALHSAAPGDYIMFVNADMVVSTEAFTFCERAFAKGKHLISCPAIRTIDNDPPIGAKARDLIEWSWKHKHQFTADCIWDKGHVAAPPYVLFEDSDGVVMHAFDLHPLAVSKYHAWEYVGPTASEIIMMFNAYDTHIVATPDDVAIAESCNELEYGRLDKVLDAETAVHWGRHFALQMQHRQFRRQIRLIGYGHNPTAQHFADLILDGVDFVPDTPKRHRIVSKGLRQWILSHV